MLCNSIGGGGGSCLFHYRCFRTFVILHFSFIAGGNTFLGLPEACFHYMIEGVCLSLCLVVCLFVRLFVCLFVCLFVRDQVGLRAAYAAKNAITQGEPSLKKNGKIWEKFQLGKIR